MAGPGRRRLRASSTSTVATVDERVLSFLQENQVVRPPAPGTAPDDLPCFELTEAAVYDRHGQMANLLHVDLEGPFLVRGLLNIEPDQAEYLTKGLSKSRSLWLEISRSYSYSYALKPEAGMPIVWAAGQSAHFEISPSERYSPIANIMFQGVVMYYHIYDIYEAEVQAMSRSKSRVRKRKPRLEDVELPIEEILFRYAAAVGDGSTLEEVTERCKSQAAFLLTRFPKGTNFHNWLAELAPDIAKRLKKVPEPVAADMSFAEPQLPQSKPSRSRQELSSAESLGKRKAGQRASAPRSTRSSSRAQTDRADLANDEQRTSRARSERNRPKQPPKLGKHDTSDKADVDMLDFTPKSFALPAQVKKEDSSADIHPALATIIEVLNEERAKMLAAWNSGAKQRKHPDTLLHGSWCTRVYLGVRVTNYAAREEVLQYHAEGLAKHLGKEWHDSQLYEWVTQNAHIKPKFEYIPEAKILQIKKRQRAPKEEKEASASTSVGKTSAETIGKRPRGRPSGKAAGLRPSLGGGKRLRNPFDDEDDMDLDDEARPPRKAARMSQDSTIDDGDQVYDEDNDDEAEEEDEEADEASTSSDDSDEKDTQSLTRVVIRADPLPSMKPKGPNQTWTCEQPDCNFVVRGADDEEGQELIRTHFEEHEKAANNEAEERALTKINLAMQESRGHMPINHLLEKIRKAKAQPGQDKLAERRVPQPISRSLLV